MRLNYSYFGEYFKIKLTKEIGIFEFALFLTGSSERFGLSEILEEWQKSESERFANLDRFYCIFTPEISTAIRADAQMVLRRLMVTE